MTLKPITLKEANEFVQSHHRHHGAVVGYKFAIGAEHNGELVGVAIVGRPVARGLDDGYTVEVTRLCTNGTRNACSFLYAAAAKAAKALGYRRIITYILETENGASLKASGWKMDGRTKGRSWNCKSRPRETRSPICDKTRWVNEFFKKD